MNHECKAVKQLKTAIRTIQRMTNEDFQKEKKKIKREVEILSIYVK